MVLRGSIVELFRFITHNMIVKITFILFENFRLSILYMRSQYLMLPRMSPIKMFTLVCIVLLFVIKRVEIKQALRYIQF